MRAFAFYACLSIPIIAWALIVLPNYLLTGTDVSTAMVYAVITLSPVIGGDFSIFGEITPMILAGSIIALMPQAKDDINYSAILLAITSYLLFIHLSVYFSNGPGAGLIAANWDNPTNSQKVVLNLVSNVRVMAIVVAAAILGFKVKGGASGETA